MERAGDGRDGRGGQNHRLCFRLSHGAREMTIDADRHPQGPGACFRIELDQVALDARPRAGVRRAPLAVSRLRQTAVVQACGPGAPMGATRCFSNRNCRFVTRPPSR